MGEAWARSDHWEQAPCNEGSEATVCVPATERRENRPATRPVGSLRKPGARAASARTVEGLRASVAETHGTSALRSIVSIVELVEPPRRQPDADALPIIGGRPGSGKEIALNSISAMFSQLAWTGVK